MMEARAGPLELHLLVRWGSFFPSFLSRTFNNFIMLSRTGQAGAEGPVFARCSPPYPREGILDVLVRGSIIRVLTCAALDNQWKSTR